MHSGEEAAEFVHELLTDLRSSGICRGPMASGRLRCDLNVSLRCMYTSTDYPRVEIKNVRNISAIRRAVEAEVRRQKETLAEGSRLLPETRHWIDGRKESTALRTKAISSWAYLPFEETALPPVSLDETTKQRILRHLVAPAAERRHLFMRWGVPKEAARLLARDYKASLFFQEAVAAGAPPRSSALFVLNDLQHIFKAEKPDKSIDPKDFAVAARAAESGRLTHKELRIYVVALAKGDTGICKQMLDKAARHPAEETAPEPPATL